jgi:hypothetical protein
MGIARSYPKANAGAGREQRRVLVSDGEEQASGGGRRRYDAPEPIAIAFVSWALQFGTIVFCSAKAGTKGMVRFPIEF